MPKPASPQARQLLADEILAQGKEWTNCANMVRGGFENLWLTPALAAIDKALNMERDDGE